MPCKIFSQQSRNCIFFALFLLLAVLFFKTSDGVSLSYKGFLTSLGSPPLSQEFLEEGAYDPDLLEKARRSFKLLEKKEKRASNIPKILHQIWLFPEPPPEDVLMAIESVKRENPEYRHIFWTRESVKDLLDAEFGRLRSHLEEDALALSDYVGASVLCQMGGVLVDPWCESLSSLEPWRAFSENLFVGVEPPVEKILFGNRRLFCSPALLGASQGHPLMKEWKSVLKQRMGAFRPTPYEGWDLSRPYERMVWTSLASLTDLMVSSTREPILFIGPTWWCPLRPSQVDAFHLSINGQAGHKTYLRKFQETFHVGLPLFSMIEKETVMMSLVGGRLGMTSGRLERWTKPQPVD